MDITKFVPKKQDIENINDFADAYGNLGDRVENASKIIQQGSSSFSSFISIAANASGAVSSAIGALSQLTNPIGQITAAIGIAASVFAAFYSQLKTQEQEAAEYQQSIQKRMEEFQQFLEENAIKTKEELNEVDKLKDKYDELRQYMEDDGSIVSNRERALQLIQEINAALPEGVQFIENERAAWEQAEQALDNYITKKKAAVILEDKQTAYNGARDAWSTGQENLASLKNDLYEQAAILFDAKMKRDKYLADFKFHNNGRSPVRMDMIDDEDAYNYFIYNDLIEKIELKINELKEKIALAEAELEGYEKIMQDFNSFLAAVESGDYTYINRVILEIETQVKTADNATLDELIEQSKAQATSLDISLPKFQQGVITAKDIELLINKYIAAINEQIIKMQEEGIDATEIQQLMDEALIRLADYGAEYVKMAASLFQISEEDAQEILINAGVKIQLNPTIEVSEGAVEQAKEKGKEYGRDLGRAYLEGIDTGLEEMYIAQQMLTGNTTIDYTSPEYQSILDKIQPSTTGANSPNTQTGSNQQTPGQQVSDQLIADIQSELEMAMTQLTETGALTNVGTMMLQAIVAGMGEVSNLEALSGAVEGIKTALGGESMEGEFRASGSSLGSSFASGIAEGITTGSGGISNAVMSALQSAVESGKASIDSNSPSKLTRDEIGIPFAQGIGVGITEQMAAVRAAAKDESLQTAIEAARASVLAFRQDPFGGARPEITGGSYAYSGSSSTYSPSYTFNSPKALDYREMRQELRRMDQLNRLMARS